MEPQIQSHHKDLKDFINLSDTFHRDISENEVHYCKNFLPVNKNKCRAYIDGGGEEVWEGKSVQNSLREQISSQGVRKDTHIHKVITSPP